jgi:hypothetical protein
MIVHAIDAANFQRKERGDAKVIDRTVTQKAAFLPILTRNLYLSRVGVVTPGRGTKCEQFFARTLPRITLNTTADQHFSK